MIQPWWQSECGRFTLYCADCLDVLPQLEAGSVDAVVTDPPYSSGGQFRGDRAQAPSAKYVNSDTVETCRSDFAGDNRDQRSFLAWATLWMGRLHRVAKPGGVIVCFTDWRQLPTMTDAVQCGGWVWRNVCVWWKPGVRMQRGRFSASSEYAVYGSKGVPTPGKESPQNVAAFPVVGSCDKEHIAEKPVEVLEWLIGVAPEGGTILDPFTGSGTTGVACAKTSRRFIGIEISEDYCRIAKRRIQQAIEDYALFDRAPEPEPQPMLIGDNA